MKAQSAALSSSSGFSNKKASNEPSTRQQPGIQTDFSMPRSPLNNTEKHLYDFDERITRLEANLRKHTLSTDKPVQTKRDYEGNFDLNEKMRRFEDRLTNIENENSRRFSNIDNQLKFIIKLLSNSDRQNELHTADQQDYRSSENYKYNKEEKRSYLTETQDLRKNGNSLGKTSSLNYYGEEKLEKKINYQDKRDEDSNSELKAYQRYSQQLDENKKKPSEIRDSLKYSSKDEKDDIQARYKPELIKKDDRDDIQSRYKPDISKKDEKEDIQSRYKPDLIKLQSVSNQSELEFIGKVSKSVSEIDATKKGQDNQEKIPSYKGMTADFSKNLKADNENASSTLELKERNKAILNKYSNDKPIEDSKLRRSYDNRILSTFDQKEELTESAGLKSKNDYDFTNKRDSHKKANGEGNEDIYQKQKMLEEKKRKIDLEIERRIQEDTEKRKKMSNNEEYMKKISDKYENKPSAKSSLYSTDKYRYVDTYSQLQKEKKDLIKKYDGQHDRSPSQSKSPRD